MREHQESSRQPEPGLADRVLNVKRQEFAPNCVWTFKVPRYESLNQRLLKLIEKEQRSTPISRECEGREMWQSQRYVGEYPPVKKVFETIFRVAGEVVEFLKWDVADRLPACQVCWANVHPKGSYHTRHIHPATIHLSGTYYIQAPANCGDIVFHDLSRFLGLWGGVPEALEQTNYNACSLRVRPEAGLCVLFPGYLMHEVETNRSAGDRIGLAFNINFE